MSDRQEAERGPRTVTISLINGDKRLGYLEFFDPTANALMLTVPAQDFDGPVQGTSMVVDCGSITHIGFHLDAGAPRRRPDHGLAEYEIYLRTGEKLTVEADPVDVLDSVGFYARPIGRSSTFAEMFFFARAIGVREDKAPLGALLLDNDLLTLEELEGALEAQAAARAAPLGQILLEQKKVSPDALEEAVENQREQMRQGRPLRLGEILVEAGLATEEDIDVALADQKKRRGRRLGEVLIDLGVVTELDVASTLAKKFSLPFVDLEKTTIDPAAIHEIPLGLIEKYGVFPYASDDKTITVAMGDPLAMEALDMLKFSISKRLIETMAPQSQIALHLEPFLTTSGDASSRGEMDELLAEIADEQAGDAEEQTPTQVINEASGEDSAAARLVNRILIDAITHGASDIHVEPNGAEQSLVIRLRTDGICAEYRKLPAVIRSQVVARIKIMASLDIAERRKPQDGKINFVHNGQRVEFRVATIPTVTKDEDVVMRVLASAGALPLDKLGLSAPNESALRDILGRPYGLALVVGPTGSGKTTTLHAMVGSINEPTRKIWTAEDPVEITQPGIRQVQVHAKIGFTFAAAMRAFLRADPDVIMVGEMRDHETASIGVEASLTGHLVLSTLHTNSAPETITRLLDMGLDPFTFADALLGVLAQRLARRLCTDCRHSHQASSTELEELLRWIDEPSLHELAGGEPPRLWSADGCGRCGGSGFRGRLALHELLVTDEAIREAIGHKTPASKIRTMACERGMRTLVQDGLSKALAGETTLEQVLAVCSR